MSKEDNLIRETISDLTNKLNAKEEYIKILEEKVNVLQEKLYFIERNRHMEQVVEESIQNHSVEEGLKKMGLKADDLEELGDMLDEVLGKEDTDEG